MGLDLSLHILNSVADFVNGRNYEDETLWDDINELENDCYGRKTWGIYYLLRDRENPLFVGQDSLYKVTKETWDNFVATVSSATDNTEDIRHAICLVNSWEYSEPPYDNVDWTEDEDLPQEVYEAYHLVEAFCDSIQNVNPTLGYAWDARAILDWYEANDKIQAAFNAGKELLLVASY